MRHKKARSFNLQSLNIDQLPIKRILLISILAYLCIVIELFLLTSYRMLYLPHAAATFCGDAAVAYVPCVNEVIKLMLFGGQWSAIKFSIYTFTITPLFYLLLSRQKGSPVSSLMLLTLVLLIIIAATIRPSWIELASVIVGGLLAACFITKKRLKLK